MSHFQVKSTISGGKLSSFPTMWMLVKVEFLCIFYHFPLYYHLPLIALPYHLKNLLEMRNFILLQEFAE